MDAFIKECVAQVRKKPYGPPPHAVIFKVAERMKFTRVRINERTHAYFKKHKERIVHGDSDFLDGPIRVSFRDEEGDDCTIQFLWVDPGKLRVRGTTRRV